MSKLLLNLTPQQAAQLPSLPPSDLAEYVAGYHALLAVPCPVCNGDWFGCGCKDNPRIIERLHVVLATVLAAPGRHDPEVVRQAEELKAHLQGVVQLLRIAPV